MKSKANCILYYSKREKPRHSYIWSQTKVEQCIQLSVWCLGLIQSLLCTKALRRLHFSDYDIYNTNALSWRIRLVPYQTWQLQYCGISTVNEAVPLLMAPPVLFMDFSPFTRCQVSASPTASSILQLLLKPAPHGRFRHVTRFGHPLELWPALNHTV